MDYLRIAENWETPRQSGSASISRLVSPNWLEGISSEGVLENPHLKNTSPITPSETSHKIIPDIFLELSLPF